MRSGVLRLSILAIALAAMATAACGPRYVDEGRQRRLTGTCEGACDHYMACKQADDEELFTACHAECSEAFSDSASLRGFESLSCYDAVGFVEGASGRMPGQPPAGTQ